MADIAPMTLREAIEVMKIVGPHAALLRNAPDNLVLIKRLWDTVSADSPVHLLRLLALMEHKEVEKIADEYEASRGPEGVDAKGFILRLAEGFGRNPLNLLVNAAFQLGMTETGWSHGRRNG